MHQMKLLPLKYLLGEGLNRTGEISAAGDTGGRKHAKSHSAAFSLTNCGAESNAASDPPA